MEKTKETRQEEFERKLQFYRLQVECYKYEADLYKSLYGIDDNFYKIQKKYLNGKLRIAAIDAGDIQEINYFTWCNIGTFSIPVKSLIHRKK